jgi:hypothetical protein
LALALILSLPAKANESVIQCDPGRENIKIAYGDIVVCSIEVIGDRDAFGFQGTEGEVVYIQIATTRGPGAARFQLFEPDGTPITDPNISSYKEKLKLTGMYTILVGEFGNNQTCDYNLILERIVPVSPTAQELPYETPQTDTIDPVVDADPFFFAANSGDSVSLAISPVNGPGAPRFQLFNPDGTPKSAANINSFQEVLDQTGKYVIMVSEFGNNQTAGYTLDLKCIAGKCGPEKSFPFISFGVVYADHRWKPVSFRDSRSDAVVIAGPPTSCDSDPGVARIRNIGESEFEARFAEWKYLFSGSGDDAHAVEAIPYLVLPKNRFIEKDGSMWEIGTFTSVGNNIWTRVKFSQSFMRPPHIFLTAQTANGTDPIVVRARNVDQSGFEVALYEEEALRDSGHTQESIGYVAITSPSPTGEIEVEGVRTPFYLYRAKVDHNPTTVLGSQIRLEEEQSADEETLHIEESVDVLVLGDQIFAQEVSSLGLDTAAIRQNIRACPACAEATKLPDPESVPIEPGTDVAQPGS